MTTLDHGRRLAVVLLVVIALLLVPSIAIAKFNSSRTAELRVGTDQMASPAAVSGTYQCTYVNPQPRSESFTVTISSFADAGPAGATYDYVLSGRVVRTGSSAGRSITLSTGSLSSDGTATQWTITIQARLGGWTGAPYTRSVTCPAKQSASGPL